MSKVITSQRVHVDIRVRTEINERSRALGSINDLEQSADGDAGWLVLACENQSVLEVHMLPGEYAFEAEQRFRAASAEVLPRQPGATWTPTAVLLAHLEIGAWDGDGCLTGPVTQSSILRAQ